MLLLLLFYSRRYYSCYYYSCYYYCCYNCHNYWYYHHY